MPTPSHEDVPDRRATLGLLLLLACRPTATTEHAAAPARREPASIAPDSRCGDVRGTLHAVGDARLHLETVDVEAVVEGPVARTQMTLAIANDREDDDEAVMTFELPHGAVVRELALDVDGTWQRARVVPRAEGRGVYDAIVAQRIDPAIVEQTEPDRIDLRVFPIPDDGVARVRLVWLQPLLEDRAPLVLPLCGLPEIGALTVAVDERVGDAVRRHGLARRGVRVDAPLGVALDGGRPGAIRQGKFVAARVDAETVTQPDPIDALTILVDTSASRAGALVDDVARIEALTSALARHTPPVRIQLVAFDERLVPLFDGDAADVGETLARLRARGALGGTDWVGAIDALAALNPARRVLLVTDGEDTIGAHEPGPSRERLRKRLRDAGVQRLDVLGPASLRRPASAIVWLVREGDRPGRVLATRTANASLLDALAQTTQVATVELTRGRVASARRWFEGDVDSLLLVELDEGATWSPRLRAATIAGRDSAPAITSDLVAPLVLDADVRRLDVDAAWLATGDARRLALASEAEKVALDHRLLSSHTALLALESRVDFVRWGLEPGLREPEPRSAGIEHMKALEPEAARLEAMSRRYKVLEDAYLRELEAWLLASQEGRAEGPRPDRREFEAAFEAAERARFDRALHAAEAPRTDLVGRVGRALAAGEIADARRWVADAWTAKPGAPTVALAGGLVEAAAGDRVAAARWLSTVPELLRTGDPLHGSAVWFVDPHAADREAFDRLLPAFERARAGDAPLLRAIAALARGDAALAITQLDAAIATHRDMHRTAPWRRSESAVPRSHAVLLAIAAAMLPPHERARAAAILRRHRVAPMRAPATVVVVMHNALASGRFDVAIEATDHQHVGAEPAALARWDDRVGARTYAHDGLLPADSRAYLWRRDSDGTPVVGAIYQVRFDGRTAEVRHDPFALVEDALVVEAL